MKDRIVADSKQEKFENIIENKKRIPMDPVWKQNIRRMKGNICELCGRENCDWLDSENRLQIHHLIAVRDGGNDEMDNLMLLCPMCHKIMERKVYMIKLYQILQRRLQ